MIHLYILLKKKKSSFLRNWKVAKRGPPNVAATIQEKQESKKQRKGASIVKLLSIFNIMTKMSIAEDLQLENSELTLL